MFRFALPIHSCFLPCDDLGCSPAAILRTANAAGLNRLMITDPNTARNAPALEEDCRREARRCLFGLEISSSGGARILAVSNALEQAAAITELCYAK